MHSSFFVGVAMKIVLKKFVTSQLQSSLVNNQAKRISINHQVTKNPLVTLNSH